MLNRFIGKEVEITVAFASYLHSTAPLAVVYYGILREVDEEFCLVSLSYKMLADVNPGRLTDGSACQGDMCIKKAYILTCKAQS